MEVTGSSIKLDPCEGLRSEYEASAFSLSLNEGAATTVWHHFNMETVNFKYADQNPIQNQKKKTSDVC